MRTIPLPENSGATGSAIVDDSIAYVGNPNLNTVSRINYLTGATSEVPAGVYPAGLIFTRGKLFVINANLDETFSPAGPSWLTVIDPAINAEAPGVDSIGLTGEGNASFAAVGSDGLVYVMSTGDYFSGEGRLSVVDPLARTEVASFAGFGTGPGNVAADADARIFVSSYSRGRDGVQPRQQQGRPRCGPGRPHPVERHGRGGQQGAGVRDRDRPLLRRPGGNGPRAGRGSRGDRYHRAGRMPGRLGRRADSAGVKWRVGRAGGV